ncbi:MAG: helix-turn-helix transcriptional regulator [Flavobacteriales bacterium]|nr:helix-turn-helix transcriptional regulator [Flavobacteriales bacterium]
MSKIGSNIRKIRLVKGLSQSAFGNLFNLKRANIGAYEELRAEPKIDVVIEIAKYFSVPLSDIFTKDLTVNQLTKFSAAEDMKSTQRQEKTENYFSLGHISAELLMNRIKLFEQLEKDNIHQIQFPKVVDHADKFFEIKGVLILGAKNQQYHGLICSSIRQGVKSMIVLVLSDKRIALGEYLGGKEKVTIKLQDSQEETIIEDVRQLFEVKLMVSQPGTQSTNIAQRLLTIEKRVNNLEGKS